ncbi:asparagine synthase-domain-containing protein [Terfezia claveryi]|nr:asparagine synthase-domain-containing protein [Terfezia claveryi]
MCGILFRLSSQPPPPPSLLPSSLLTLVSNRGPNFCSTHTITHASSSIPTCHHHLQFTSTVLSLRGDHLAPQPLTCSTTGSVLCWNGEAWRIAGHELPREKNDGEEVFKLLLGSEGEGVKGVTRALSSISGPFAFVFYDKPNGRVWFGRDCLGRRSLLRHQASVERDGHDGVIVASVTDGDKQKGWEEVEADGVYYIDLERSTPVLQLAGLQQVPFLQKGDTSTDGVHMQLPFPPLNRTFPPSIPPHPLTLDSKAPHELKVLLQEAVRLRVQHIYTPGQPLHEADGLEKKKSKVGILFSGGLDCTVIARLAHEVLPHHEPIDLLNVAFENPRVVEARTNGPTPPKNHKKKKLKDSTAELNGATPAPAPDTQTPPVPIDPYSLCPDRQTCISSLRDLQSSCPTRTFNLILINIPLSETLSHRQSVVDLIYPHNTEMDLSIALAFYFASRGHGALYNPNPTHESPSKQYATPARILLSGLGADELFAGYARHETAFRREGYDALLTELNLDVGRLGKRNLGRDDRVISQWGKEGRYPFLDERVVVWAMERCVWEKCDFEQRKDGNVEGEGGKKVLRLVAQMLGMQNVSWEKKRAVQFGARTAKMECHPRGGRVKGTRLLS